MVKNLPAIVRDTRDVGLMPGWGRFPGGGNENPLQRSCLGNYEQRSLAGYSSWGLKESAQLSVHTHGFLSVLRECTRPLCSGSALL